MTEKTPSRPPFAEDDDFSDLNYDTVMDLFVRDDISEDDKKNAEAEIGRREELGDYGDESAPDPEVDLANHGYVVKDGEMYYPTKKAKEFIKEEMLGPIPPEWRESLKERAKKTTAALNNTEVENERPLSPEEKSEMICERMRKYKLKIDGFRDHVGFPASLLNRSEEYVRGKESSMGSNKDENPFVKVSEPLMTIVLGGAGMNGGVPKFFSDTAFETQAKWATKFDDYRNATDVILSVKDNDPSGLGWISYSIDVTTATKSEKPNDGVLGKFKESNDKTGAPRSFLGDIDDNGNPRKSPSWVNEITFCYDPNGKHSIEETQHFIVGLSRETISEIVDNLTMGEKGAVVDMDLDKDIQFMIASELFEEIRMQKTNFPNKESMESKRLKPIRNMVLQKLKKLLEIKPEDDAKTFGEKYEQKCIELREKDPVYSMIVQQSREYRKEYYNLHNQ